MAAEAGAGPGDGLFEEAVHNVCVAGGGLFVATLYAEEGDGVVMPVWVSGHLRGGGLGG